MSRVSFRPRALSEASQQAERGSRCDVGHLLEADALAHVEMLVHPLAPFRIVHGEHGPGALLGGEAREETLGGVAHGRGGDAGGVNAEEAGLDRSVGRDAFEWIGQTFALVLGGHLAEALRHIGRVLRKRVRGENRAGRSGSKTASGASTAARRDGVRA